MTILTTKVTYAEFRSMEFDEADNYQYELLNGEVVKKASPTVLHQRISMRLLTTFLKFLEQHPAGELFHAPLDVVLDEFNVPQPDIIFIRRTRLTIIDEQEQIVRGAPDLLIEILSPGSIRRDRFDKKDLYERYGIEEFWIVDPNNQSIEVYQLEEGAYQLFAFAAGSGPVQSSILEGLMVETGELFA